MYREFWKNKRFRQIAAGFFLLAVFLCFSFLRSGADIAYRRGGESPEDWAIKTSTEKSDSKEAIKDDEKPKENEMIFVDVSGCVVRPGVYQLPRGSRLFEAIELAGGLTEDGDVRSINRARTLSDEEVILVLSRTEYENRAEALKSEGKGDERVELNSAGAEALERLSGVGPAMAQRILEYRNVHGPFRRIEDLLNVSGIGEKTFERLKDSIYVK